MHSFIFDTCYSTTDLTSLHWVWKIKVIHKNVLQTKNVTHEIKSLFYKCAITVHHTTDTHVEVCCACSFLRVSQSDGQKCNFCKFFSRQPENTILRKALVSSSAAVWTAPLLCWVLAPRFICFVSCFIWPTSSGSAASESLSHLAHKVRMHGGKEPRQRDNKLQESFHTIPPIHTNCYFHSRTFFTWLVQLITYHRAIFMLLWMYRLHIISSFGSFTHNQITSHGLNLLRADRGVYCTARGKVAPLRDDFQVLFCHSHELNIVLQPDRGCNTAHSR